MDLGTEMWGVDTETWGVDTTASELNNSLFGNQISETKPKTERLSAQLKDGSKKRKLKLDHLSSDTAVKKSKTENTVSELTDYSKVKEEKLSNKQRKKKKQRKKQENVNKSSHNETQRSLIVIKKDSKQSIKTTDLDTEKQVQNKGNKGIKSKQKSKKDKKNGQNTNNVIKKTSLNSEKPNVDIKTCDGVGNPSKKKKKTKIPSQNDIKEESLQQVSHLGLKMKCTEVQMGKFQNRPKGDGEGQHSRNVKADRINTKPKDNIEEWLSHDDHVNKMKSKRKKAKNDDKTKKAENDNKEHGLQSKSDIPGKNSSAVKTYNRKPGFDINALKAALSQKVSVQIKVHDGKSSTQHKLHDGTPSTKKEDIKFSKKKDKKSPNEKDKTLKKEESVRAKTKDKSIKSLKERMTDQLKAARFRYLNEQLYTQTSHHAYQMFQDNEDAFHVYHDGFQGQVSKWPVNPVNLIIEYIKSRGKHLIVADFGCGDAKISRSVPNKVHSFDLVATNEHVTVCDMSKVPLKDQSIDIAVFCLSLMGTNLSDYLKEANRVLKKGGVMKIAEVTSRFQTTNLSRFIVTVEKFGFQYIEKDTNNKMFVMMDFRKVKPPKSTPPDLQLSPCLYKKR